MSITDELHTEAGGITMTDWTDIPNKTIFALLDTDELADYLNSNLWLFVDNPDCIDDETYQELMTYVITKATDGRLERMVRDCLDTWAGNVFGDMLYSTIDDFIGTAIGESGINLDCEEE